MLLHVSLILHKHQSSFLECAKNLILLISHTGSYTLIPWRHGVHLHRDGGVGDRGQGQEGSYLSPPRIRAVLRPVNLPSCGERQRKIERG